MKIHRFSPWLRRLQKKHPDAMINIWSADLLVKCALLGGMFYALYLYAPRF